jgi:AraC-like DNA-binding protein
MMPFLAGRHNAAKLLRMDKILLPPSGLVGCRKRMPTRPRSAQTASHVERTPLGIAVSNFPSDFARQCWLYVIRVGAARMPVGARYQHSDRDGFLLHFVRRGKMEYRLRQTRLSASAGQCCLMDLSEAIQYESVGTGRAEYYWVSFNGKDMTRIFLELRADSLPIFPLADFDGMAARFRELLSLCRRKPPAYEPRCSALLTLLLTDLFLSRQGNTAPAQGLPGTGHLAGPVRRGIELMMARYFDVDLGVKQIATIAGLSMYRFSHLFKQQTGVSVIAFLTRLRMEQARTLLLHSNRPVAEIGRMVGIARQNYFARVFRRFYGATPVEFRRKELERSRRGSRGGQRLPPSA